MRRNLQRDSGRPRMGCWKGKVRRLRRIMVLMREVMVMEIGRFHSNNDIIDGFKIIRGVYVKRENNKGGGCSWKSQGMIKMLVVRIASIMGLREERESASTVYSLYSKAKEWAEFPGDTHILRCFPPTFSSLSLFTLSSSPCYYISLQNKGSQACVFHFHASLSDFNYLFPFRPTSPFLYYIFPPHPGMLDRISN